MYQQTDVKLKRGKYGPYLENGSKKYSLKEYGGDVETITLAQAIEYIESINAETATTGTPLSADMSIRHGKYGAYVYYKTKDMKKPQFLSLKKYEYEEKEPGEIIEWITQKYLS